MFHQDHPYNSQQASLAIIHSTAPQDVLWHGFPPPPPPPPPFLVELEDTSPPRARRRSTAPFLDVPIPSPTLSVFFLATPVSPPAGAFRLLLAPPPPRSPPARAWSFDLGDDDYLCTPAPPAYGALEGIAPACCGSATSDCDSGARPTEVAEHDFSSTAWGCESLWERRAARDGARAGETSTEWLAEAEGVSPLGRRSARRGRDDWTGHGRAGSQFTIE